MDRSDTPTLLLPLLALLAIAFPFAMYRTPASSGGNNPQASQPAEQQVTREPGKQRIETKPHTAARLIEEFLDARSYRNTWPEGDPRSDYSLDFMIAIAADPIDSRLVRMFDSSIDSIERAFEADGYDLDRFDLAWSKTAGSKADAKTGIELNADAEPPRYRRQPSLLLFRKPPDLEKKLTDPNDEASKGKLFLVFLVGETPTSGIHKAAMADALRQLASFYQWVPGPDKLPDELLRLAQKNPGTTIKIMGPSFTGSATSLEFTLRDWLAGLPARERSRVKFQIVSGSATSIDPKEFSNIESGGPHTFQAVVPPDDPVMDRIYEYIGGLGRGRAYKRIAMLSEAGTAYGQATIRRDETDGDGTGKENEQANLPSDNAKQQSECAKNHKTDQEPEILNLPFPLHISELRSASANQRHSKQNAASEVMINPGGSLPLNEAQSSQPKEIPPSFSTLGAPSSELVLSSLLSTISHEGIHAVGILATDVRDVLFLAREIHRHCPGTLVFTVFSDMLFSHADVSTSTRGMLVFTPYSLFNPNQVWTPPFPGLGNRFQFPSQDAEGAYNATLALLGRKDLMLDYGQPFPFYPGRAAIGPLFSKPALWVTVVGRHGPLPVKTLKWSDSKNYAVTVPRAQSDPPTLHDEGTYRANTVLGMVLLSVVLIVLSWLVIFRYHVPERLEGPGRPSLSSRLLGEPLTPEYRRQVRLFLLASLVCLLAAYIVLAAVFSLPAIASRSLGTLPPFWNSWVLIELVTNPAAAALLAVPLLTHKLWWTGFLLVSIFITVGLLSLAAAVVEVGCTVWKAPREKGVLRGVVQVIILVGCAFVILFLAPRLAGVWIFPALKGFPEAFFTYVRAFQLFSGLSPLVPLFCVTLAGLLWAFCSFRRLRMIDGLRVEGGGAEGEEPLLALKTQSFNGLKALETTIRMRLEKASPFSTLAYCVLIGVGLFAAAYLFFLPYVPSYEGHEFYFLFGWGFFLVYAALTTEFGRLCLAWAAFRHLLRRLALHPMREAYGRYRVSFPGLPRIDLVAPLKAFSVLSFSVDQAERLLRMAPDLVSSDKLSEAHRQKLERWIPGAWVAFWDANKYLSRALEENSNGNWRLAITERSRSQQALGRLTQMTAELLEPSWRAPKNTPSLPMESEQFKEFRELAEEFLAGRVVLLISYVLPSLRKLGTFILIGLLLMLASVMFYPFVQKNHFLAFNWVVILGFVVLALVVTIQMERDVVLSALNGTTPGQVKMSRQFAFRILTYVMIPILALLSAQFPDTLGQVISWFTAFQGH